MEEQTLLNRSYPELTAHSDPPAEIPLNGERLAFWSLVIFASVIRLNDLATGLPLHSLYGETDTIGILRHMLQTGDFNPYQFDVPGLAYYLILPFLLLFYYAGQLTGHFSNLNMVSDASFLFIGRAVCGILGAASVPLVYRIGKQFSTATALISMAIFAAVPQHIEYSLMLRPEVPAIFFCFAGDLFRTEDPARTDS